MLFDKLNLGEIVTSPNGNTTYEFLFVQENLFLAKLKRCSEIISSPKFLLYFISVYIVKLFVKEPPKF
jgi:hypothetical protein